MSLMFWEKDGTVARLVMTAGENRHNLDFIDAILTNLDEIEDDAGVTALVLTSNDPKNFSQGIDLSWVAPRYSDPAGQQDVKDFLYGLNNHYGKISLFKNSFSG